jgi:hypothetical protein
MKCYSMWRLSWPWSYGSWIYNYLCNQCSSPLMLWVWISIRARCTTLCDKVCQWLATGWWFSPGPPVSSTNKTDCHDITEILLKVALKTIKQTNKQTNKQTTNSYSMCLPVLALLAKSHVIYCHVHCICHQWRKFSHLNLLLWNWLEPKFYGCHHELVDYMS